MMGSWVVQDDRTLVTATMGGAELNGGLINIFDLNNDGQANGYNEAKRYISATNVNTLAFKGQNFSTVYFIQSNTGIMFQSPWQENGVPTLFAVNSLLQNTKFLTYHSNGNFYALKDNNILQISGDGSIISMLFGAGQSPLLTPVQLTVGYDNNLYVADDGRDNLFKISPTTLEATALLQAGLFNNLRGVAIEAIPEPAMIAMLGLGGLTLLRRPRA